MAVCPHIRNYLPGFFIARPAFDRKKNKVVVNFSKVSSNQEDGQQVFLCDSHSLGVSAVLPANRWVVKTRIQRSSSCSNLGTVIAKVETM
jgi:hypothetical protein